MQAIAWMKTEFNKHSETKRLQEVRLGIRLETFRNRPARMLFFGRGGTPHLFLSALICQTAVSVQHIWSYGKTVLYC